MIYLKSVFKYLFIPILFLLVFSLLHPSINSKNMVRFVFERNNPSFENLDNWYPANKIILPISASSSWRWVFYRILGINFKKLSSINNFEHIQKNWKILEKRVEGFFISPSVLMTASDDELVSIVNFSKKHDIKIFMDNIKETSFYYFGRELNGKKFIEYVDFIFGPQMDNASLKNTNLSEKNILKHFGFYGIDNKAIKNSHDTVIDLNQKEYTNTIEIEIQRYTKTSSCERGGIMLGHIRNKDTNKMLFSDFSVIQRLHDTECKIYTDAINMANIWREDIDPHPSIYLLFTDYKGWTKILSNNK